MRRWILSSLLVLVALPAMAMEGGKLTDERRLGPPEERLLKILWQQQKAWQAHSLGYLVKSGVLLDADHPMDAKKQANLLALMFPNEPNPSTKWVVVNTILQELVPSMLTRHSGSDLAKGGYPPGDAWIFRITPRGNDYLKKIGVK